MRKVAFAAALMFALLSPSIVKAEDVWVDGYTRSNGTYVQGHYRSGPDSNSSNNWSTRGNQNPYTGSWGTRQPSYDSYSPSGSSYGGSSSRNVYDYGSGLYQRR